MMRHIGEVCREVIGEDLPKEIMLLTDLPGIEAKSGMVFYRDGITWVNDSLEYGILAWRVRKGILLGEICEATKARAA